MYTEEKTDHLQTMWGKGEMALLLRVLATLPEDLGFILSTHMTAHDHLELQHQVIQCPL